MNSSKTLWILEADPAQQQLYRDMFSFRYKCSFFSDLKTFASLYSSENSVCPDFLITELQLSDGDFFNFIKSKEDFCLERMKKRFMVISNHDDLDLMRHAFEWGAVDYMVRPFHKNELIVKLERYLQDSQCLSHLFPEEVLSELTPKEEKILQFLMAAKNNTMHRDDICRMVWKKVFVNTKTFDVHIYNLRRKINLCGTSIRSEGQGLFRLVSESKNRNLA